jgi:hypothetical protein
MNERTVTISLYEYNDLVRKAERIATLGRMFAESEYISVGDIKMVLNLDERKETAQ